MSKNANFRYVKEECNHRQLVIEDVGPWDEYKTITNDAEAVVKRLSPELGDRRLLYYDSDGDLSELLVENGQFNGFASFYLGLT